MNDKEKVARSREYWKRRATELSKEQNQKIDKMTAELAEAWEKAINDVQKEIEAWYARFGSEQGMSLADARKVLDARSMKALRMDLKEFEAKARENDDDRWTKELKAASARVHLTRLQQIELQIRNRLYEIYHKTEDTTSAAIRDMYTNERYHNEYLRQQKEGKFSDLAKIPEKQLDTVIKKPWASDGKVWSSRIWDSREKLAGQLQGELTRVLLQGKSPAEAGKRIAKKMGVGEYQALRLVNTECTYAQSLADKDSFKNMNVKKVQYLATLESNTCGTCGELDGKVFELKDATPGVTAPPMHPNCRCTLVPYFEDETSDRWMRDPDTQKGRMVRQIDFPTWKEAFVDDKTGEVAMRLNITPPTDKFIEKLAKEQGKPYTLGKKGEERFYADNGIPIWPPNDGAVGKTSNITLEAGAHLISRYGDPTGRYASPDGTTIEERALSRTTDLSNYHVYKVLKEINNVKMGIIAPWFGKKGEGVQYLLPARIIDLLDNLTLEEVRKDDE
jgi:SPP1 gp7 family putative phage head morphogenesis protein